MQKFSCFIRKFDLLFARDNYAKKTEMHVFATHLSIIIGQSKDVESHFVRMQQIFIDKWHYLYRQFTPAKPAPLTEVLESDLEYFASQ